MCSQIWAESIRYSCCVLLSGVSFALNFQRCFGHDFYDTGILEWVSPTRKTKKWRDRKKKNDRKTNEDISSGIGYGYTPHYKTQHSVDATTPCMASNQNGRLSTQWRIAVVVVVKWQLKELEKKREKKGKTERYIALQNECLKLIDFWDKLLNCNITYTTSSKS